MVYFISSVSLCWPLAWPKLACFHQGGGPIHQRKSAINGHFSSTHLFLRNAEVPNPKDHFASETRSSVSSFLELGVWALFLKATRNQFIHVFGSVFTYCFFFKTTVDFQKRQSLNLIKFRFRSTSWLLEVSYFAKNKIEDYPTSGNLEGLKSKPSRSMATSTNPTQICGTGKHELGSCLVSLGCKVHLFVAWMLQKTSLWIFMVQ